MAQNISRKTAYDVKEASNPSLTKKARKNYAENAQAGVKDDNPIEHKSPLSFMSKHSQSSPLNAKFKKEGGAGVHDAETDYAPIDNRMGNVTKK